MAPFNFLIGHNSYSLNPCLYFCSSDLLTMSDLLCNLLLYNQTIILYLRHPYSKVAAESCCSLLKCWMVENGMLIGVTNVTRTSSQEENIIL